MLLTIHHRTHYVYDTPQRRIIQSLRLTPTPCKNQKIHEWSITAEGAAIGAAFTDGAGDQITTLTLKGPVSEMDVVVRGVIETFDYHGVLTGHREMVSPALYLRHTVLTAPDQAILELAHSAASGQEAGSLALAHALCGAVRASILYQPGSTHHDITAAEALSEGAGVCQDHSHALIAIARANGYPARYVVGYLHSDADGKSHEASHAWCEIHITGLGWVGFDATNGCCPDERYVRLGSGLDAHHAAPIRGISVGAGHETMNVNVSIGSDQ